MQPSANAPMLWARALYRWPQNPVKERDLAERPGKHSPGLADVQVIVDLAALRWQPAVSTRSPAICRPFESAPSFSQSPAWSLRRLDARTTKSATPASFPLRLLANARATRWIADGKSACSTSRHSAPQASACGTSALPISAPPTATPPRVVPAGATPCARSLLVRPAASAFLPRSTSAA